MGNVSSSEKSSHIFSTKQYIISRKMEEKESKTYFVALQESPGLALQIGISNGLTGTFLYYHDMSIIDSCNNLVFC